MRLAKSKHEFNSAMIGMIMGDTYISQNKSTYMYIRHGGKQLSYVDEKVEYLSNYIKPISLQTCKDNKGFTYRYAYYRNNGLKYLYKNFYIKYGKKSKKYLNVNIINRFDDISLAFLYMDDGCLSVRKKNGEYTKQLQIILNTQAFSKEENLWLISLLKRKFDLDFKIAKDKNNYRLWCSTKSAIKMLYIVSPIVKEFKSMHYKLDIKQENNPFLK